MCSQPLGKGEKLFLPKKSPVIGQTTTDTSTRFHSICRTEPHALVATLTFKPASFRFPLREMEIEGILILMRGCFK